MLYSQPLIGVLFGTRPEAIKMAPIVQSLKSDSNIRTVVCVTGQHREMLDQILKTFAIVPDFDLNVMTPGQSLAALSARALMQIDDFLLTQTPQLLLVQGDTTTALAAALAAFYHNIPVGHVEAGLRTGNLHSPWPEEANRRLITQLTTLHFAPTTKAAENLRFEGVAGERIFMTGNPVIDALMVTVKQVDANPPTLPGLPIDDRRLVLITGHRRENFGPSFEAICRAIAELARQFPNVRFVYPVHLNPNVRDPVNRILQPAKLSNVHLLEPLPYREFIYAFRKSTLVLSDSGGVQEEATALGKPVLLMRDTTERPEAVTAGCVKLIGTEYQSIVNETSNLLRDATALQAMSRVSFPFGDGLAAQHIARICSEYVHRVVE